MSPVVTPVPFADVTNVIALEVKPVSTAAWSLATTVFITRLAFDASSLVMTSISTSTFP